MVGLLSNETITDEQRDILEDTIVDCFSIYQSLNTVEEFPEYFEETLETWATAFYDVLCKPFFRHHPKANLNSYSSKRPN